VTWVQRCFGTFLGTLVRRILTNAYHSGLNGICGNDDVGQMSAWYVLGAIGFYPVCPGDGIYILGSPLFSRATLRLDEKWCKGAKFTITAENQAPDHPYVQSAKLNGSPLSRAWIRHSEIVSGGALEFVMGLKPNEGWATRKEDLPPSGTFCQTGNSCREIINLVSLRWAILNQI